VLADLAAGPIRDRRSDERAGRREQRILPGLVGVPGRHEDDDRIDAERQEEHDRRVEDAQEEHPRRRRKRSEEAPEHPGDYLPGAPPRA
jgi:hypothetical protein